MTGVLSEGQRKILKVRADEQRAAAKAAQAAAEAKAKAAEAKAKAAEAKAQAAQAQAQAQTAQAQAQTAETQAQAAQTQTQEASSAGAPAQGAAAAQSQQAAAPSGLPFGTTREAETFLKTKANIKDKLQRYNRKHFILEDQGSYKVFFVDSVRVLELEGDRLTARIKFTVASTRRSSSTGTFDFVMRWQGNDVELQSHARR